MPTSQFQFDESGNYFFCFLVASYTLFLLPFTYLYWPKSESKEHPEHVKKKCLCQPCQQKRLVLRSTQSNKTFRKAVYRLLFVLAWALLFYMYYNMFFEESTKPMFDPFEILDISIDATAAEIRKAYKKLSLMHHPDKGGEETTFIKISKAYAALTNEDSRKNWQEYGNPDGPEATHFGIALPKWIIAKENKFLVIGFYVFLFLLVLPIGVGKWWYNTMRYSASTVLLSTKQLYMYTFYHSHQLPQRMILNILSKSHEFSSEYSKEVRVRPSDNVEIPPLIKHIPEFTVFKKAILGAPYEIKSRVLIYAHLMRLELNSNTLLQDQNYIVKQCPKLLNEMITSCVSVISLYTEHMEMKNKRQATVDLLISSMEACMELVPQIIQGILDSPPLTQLPHMDNNIMKSLGSGGKQKIMVKTLSQLAALPEDKRRHALHSLSDEQYQDVMNVLASMPHVTLEVRYEVQDEEEHPNSIWPYTIITGQVTLKRSPLLSLQQTASSANAGNLVNQGENSSPSLYDTPSPKHKPKLAEDESAQANSTAKKSSSTSSSLISSQVCSHLVHCPLFPSDKFEGWWLYVVDRKNKRLIVPPQYICNLQTEQEVEIKFLAPNQTGSYVYNVFLRSDSYVDFVSQETIKFQVDPVPEDVKKQMMAGLLRKGHGRVSHADDSCEESSDDEPLLHGNDSDSGNEASSGEDQPKQQQKSSRKKKTAKKFTDDVDENDSSDGYESEAERIFLEERDRKRKLASDAETLVADTDPDNNNSNN